LTAEAVARLGASPGKKGAEADVVSELSAAFSEDSDMLPTQNALIVRLTKIQYNQERINQILGMKKALGSAV